MMPTLKHFDVVVKSFCSVGGKDKTAKTEFFHIRPGAGLSSSIMKL